MSENHKPVQPDKPQTIVPLPPRPVSPDWQRDCRRFGAWLSGTSFVAALAWLTGANALVPLSNGKVIHASYVSWPLALMLLGLVLGGYIYQAASHERLPILGRKRMEVDHSYRYSLLFVEPRLRWQLYDTDEKLGVQLGVRFSNGFNKPIQVYLEDLEASANGVQAAPYTTPFRKMRIMPNQIRHFTAPVIPDIPQGYFDGRVKYSVLYGPLDASTVYRHRHEFSCEVNGVRVRVADLRENSGANEWADEEAEVDSDMPEGFNYPDS